MTEPAPAPVPWWKRPYVWVAAASTALLGVIALLWARTSGRRQGHADAVEAQSQAADRVEEVIVEADRVIDARAEQQHHTIDHERPRAPTRANIEASMEEARRGPHADRNRDPD